MSTPRVPKLEEYEKIVAFLNSQLRPQESWSISQEYPLSINTQNLHNIRIIEEDGKIISHAVVKILLVKTPIAIFRVAAIGSVVTLPEYQNRGYSTKVLKDCLDQAKIQNADFAILWTDIFDFYRRLGFELAGSETAIIFNSQIESEYNGLKFLSSKMVDPQSLLRLYNQHSMGTLRTTSDINKYLKIPNSQLFTAWDQNNHLLAYAVEGRGADLSNYIHEWGGKVSKILALISEIQRQKSTPLTLITHPSSTNLIRQATDRGALINKGYLGMIKIINTRDLFFKIKRYARYLGHEDFALEFNGTDYIVGHSGHMFRTQNEKDIVKLLFGPYKASELQSFDFETTQMLEKIFPIPLWIWGWDSV